MHRIVGGILVLVLALSVAAADAGGQGKPAMPAEQYQALLKEYRDAQLAFQKARQGAKTYEEQLLLKYPRPDQFAAKFLAFAERHDKDAAALDALLWVATNLSSQPPKGKNPLRTKALQI